jgi:DNA mismatch repair ATPase MutS
MNPYANNYILAIHMEYSPYSEILLASHDGDLPGWRANELSSMPIGLSWLDLSTGQFFTQSIRLEGLSSAIARISPSEIVLDEASQIDQVQTVLSLLKEEKQLLTYCSSTKTVPVTEWSSMLEVEVTPTAAADFTPEEAVAGSVLLHYVKMRLQGLDVKLQPPERYQATETMGIDKNSMKALEIKETIRDQLFKGSLLHAIRRTVTKSGARLLNEWLSMVHLSMNLLI